MSEKMVCVECGFEKDIEEFHFSDRAKSKRRKDCKKCYNARALRRYREKGRHGAARRRSAGQADHVARWRQNNPERYREMCRRAEAKRKPYKKAYYQANKDRIRAWRLRCQEIVAMLGASRQDILRVRLTEWLAGDRILRRQLHARWVAANEAFLVASGVLCVLCGMPEPEVSLVAGSLARPGDEGNPEPALMCPSCKAALLAADGPCPEADLRKFVGSAASLKLDPLAILLLPEVGHAAHG